MRKTIAFLFIILALPSLSLIAIAYSNYVKELNDALHVNPEEVTKITVGSSESKGQYKSTREEEKINILMNYLNQVDYQRLSGDQTSYMPTKASIIYFNENEKQSFMVPYETEAMIDHKVYKIKNGTIEDSFLIELYHSMD
ncbi:hypothetical protein J2Z83_002023 [Virgibacillus natechei]|uniref:Uncharacterized protein n=1 Tax=Virgibacillus natechei TaxID=1216297 RepID=A0ABS4IG59_9BACI|nr:hypothetical protein [Virgibacillus natechei]MBP1969915.1 hypothetical protein [Virgibacillus natechei]UZD13420.1 hypothetical protein OLD84_02340 [Virgibacillus natechei]